MVADTGPIGGDLSHEFIILAPTGESGVFFDAGFEEMDWMGAVVDHADPAAMEQFYGQMTGLYAATDEKHDEAAWAQVPAERRQGRSVGIEVGHIFYFGRKYSEPMGMTVAGTRRRAGRAGDGQLRHRRFAPGRRRDRGQP